jgi:phage/plasmid primase-like uncharacterized protein
MPRHPYPSLGIALEACGIRCHITQPIPEKGFLRLHAEGDRPGSRNVSLSRCGKGLGYLKYWKKNIEVLFRIDEPETIRSFSAPESSITNASLLVRRLMKEASLAVHSDYFAQKSLDISELRLRSVTARELKERFGYTLLGHADTPFIVVPIYSIEGRKPALKSAQLIGGTPIKKHFLKGGQKKGGFWLVRPIPKTETAPVIGVTEGVATAISAWKLFRNLGQLTTVAAAFDCGNLLPVCTSLRKRWPDAQIIVFADNDCPETDITPNLRCSPKNAGVIHAIRACRAVGARLHAPSFSENVLNKFKAAKGHYPTDWNDFLCAFGACYGE